MAPRQAAEPVSGRVRRLPGVEVVDAEAHPARPGRRTLGGWESKLFAVINSPFEEVLFLDADCYPVCDPDECFRPEHNPHGIVTWPDAPLADGAVHWASYGLSPDGQPGLNGGHYVFVKWRAWPVLHLAAHYDDHSDYYYWRSVHGVQVGGFSDQEQVRAALHKLGARSHRYADRPLAVACQSYLQAGPHGRPLFVHRFGNKFALPGQFPGPPAWNPGPLPMEATAWRYFLEWLTEPAAEDCFPDEVPGWFTRAEGELWRQPGARAATCWSWAATTAEAPSSRPCRRGGSCRSTGKPRRRPTCGSSATRSGTRSGSARASSPTWRRPAAGRSRHA